MSSAYTQGLLTPVADETDAVDLAVRGRIPAELTGRYFRNGPNPPPGRDAAHFFGGDGMIHGVRLRDGRAEWYRNRWVRTAKLAGEPRWTEDGPDLRVASANTHVIRHAGKIFALVEAGLPYEMTPELETVGPWDYGGRLTTAMTAHPKEDPVTGDLHVFGYGRVPPHLTYHRITAAGELAESRHVEVPGPTMMHDFAITESFVVWLDLPAVLDGDPRAPGLPYRWDDDYGARLGVMPRGGGDVRWFEIEPCYVFHVGNAYEQDGKIVLDAVRYSRLQFKTMWGEISRSSNPAAETGGTTLHRWTLDPGTGAVAEDRLDDRMVEFPTVNDDRVGRPSRFLYTVTEREIVKYDTVSGAVSVHDPGRQPSEAEFVPRANARTEDDGWLMSIVTRHDMSGSELLVLDARDLEPVASVELPRRVPMGFHGNWLPDA
ncbi:carotenoid oxygenase family protein [Lentzea sp. NPDC060358]|uniref:carotenoid oxygenase family protein n=1 Tax=Lentzea sp. NPDC060358 TaxID=3347103 RepID=UPI0036641C9F